MCKNCIKFDLEKTRLSALKVMQLIEKDIIIYQNALGYSIVDANCYQEKFGKIVETLNYGK